MLLALWKSWYCCRKGCAFAHPYEPCPASSCCAEAFLRPSAQCFMAKLLTTITMILVVYHCKPLCRNCREPTKMILTRHSQLRSCCIDGIPGRNAKAYDCSRGREKIQPVQFLWVLCIISIQTTSHSRSKQKHWFGRML